MSGIAMIQSRMTELSQLVSPQQASATASMSGTAASAVATASASTASGSQFASALAALGIDASGLTTDAAAGTAAGSTGIAGATGATAQGLVAAAEKYVGVPYVWGGESLAEGGLDCSGLVQRSLADVGVTGVPRVARDQMTLGTAVPSMKSALPGDLLVFDGGSHIAIYVGNGTMIDAPKPGKTVAVRDVYETPSAIRRILPQATTGSTGAPAQLTAALASASAQRTALDLMAGLGSSDAGTTSATGTSGALASTDATSWAWGVAS